MAATNSTTTYSILIKEKPASICSGLEEDNVDEEEPASEDEEEDDQSLRARLMRGILQDGRPMREKPGIR